MDVVPAVIGAFDGPIRESEPWRGTGLAVPVFSLRSQSSVGCGEFVDIKTLVDFCSTSGEPAPREAITTHSGMTSPTLRQGLIQNFILDSVKSLRGMHLIWTKCPLCQDVSSCVCV